MNFRYCSWTHIQSELSSIFSYSSEISEWSRTYLKSKFIHLLYYIWLSSKTLSCGFDLFFDFFACINLQDRLKVKRIFEKSKSKSVLELESICYLILILIWKDNFDYDLWCSSVWFKSVLINQRKSQSRMLKSYANDSQNLKLEVDWDGVCWIFLFSNAMMKSKVLLVDVDWQTGKNLISWLIIWERAENHKLRDVRWINNSASSESKTMGCRHWKRDGIITDSCWLIENHRSIQVMGSKIDNRRNGFIGVNVD